MAALVFVERHPLTGRLVEVRDRTTFGREACDVLLLDPACSRLHARLRDDEQGARIEDLGSTNGTFVNGRRIDGSFGLRAGDRVRLGHTEWDVEDRFAQLTRP